jgi:hypothetical protein
MMNKALCHPQQGDSLIWTIFEQLFIYGVKVNDTEKIWYPRFSLSRGNYIQQRAKVCMQHPERKENKSQAQLSEESNDFAILLLFCRS